MFLLVNFFASLVSMSHEPEFTSPATLEIEIAAIDAIIQKLNMAAKTFDNYHQDTKFKLYSWVVFNV